MLSAAGLAWAGAEEDAERQALIRPTNQLEIGVGQSRSTRAGYAGLYGFGQHETGMVANVDLRGGAEYDEEDASRWRLRGRNLGLDSRSLLGEYGEQGRYRLRFAYDVLPTLSRDTYQTPFSGVGSGSLTLPASLMGRAATATGPTMLPALGTAFSSYEVGTRRERGELAVESFLNPLWQIRANYRHELKEGSKVTGAVVGSVSGAVMLLPDPVRTTTDQFGLNLIYGADRQHLQFAYNGSLFRNEIKGLAFQNPFTYGAADNRLGSSPDNQFHQFKIDGARYLSPTTRLSVAASYGQMLQNQSFLPYSTSAVASALPQSSLHGRVISDSLNLRLTSRPWRDVGLLASYRFDERDNRTPVSAYTRSSYEAGTVYTISNTPYSRRRGKATLEADYNLGRASVLTVGMDRENVHRYCRQASEACTEVEHSTEDTVRGEWRQTLNEWLSGRFALSRAMRKSDAYTLLDPAEELAGMRKFIYADRERTQMRAGMTALLSEAVSLNGRVDWNDDQYRRSRFGLTRAEGRVVNLDLSYAVNDDFSLTLFYTRQNIFSRLDSRYSSLAQITVADLPNQEWTLRMQDSVDAVGIAAQHNGLLSGRLQLSGEVVLLSSQSRYGMRGGSCVSSACNAAPISLPDVSSRQFSIRTDARYELSREDSLRLFSQFNHVRSKDYAYEGIRAVSADRVMGTNEAPLLLDGHYLGLSFLHRWQ